MPIREGKAKLWFNTKEEQVYKIIIQRMNSMTK